MTRTLSVLALLALLVLAGCGSKDEPAGPAGKQHLRLTLDFFPNADHAGIYNALENGEFAKAGLDVEIQVPGDPSAPLRLLAAGKTDLAISYEPELLLARDKGADLVSIGALVQKPLTSIIAVGNRLVSPADLEDHTVGTAGIPYQSAYLKTIMAKAGADPSRVKEINVGFDLVRSMLTKRVYATLGGFWNYEGVQLERSKRKPQIIRVDEAGVPTYDELVIVARAGEVGERAPILRRFLQALARAHQALKADPEAGVAALLKADPDLDAGLQRAAVAKTLPVFFPTNEERPWGFQEPREWEAYSRWMYENKLLKRPASQAALNNDLLPGQGF